MQRHCMLISLALVLLFCTAFKLSDVNYKFTKDYPTTSGTVTFDHEAHATGRDKDCVNCHSALETFGGEVSELLAHNYCKACHETKNGPTDCNGCHSQKKVALK